MIKLSIFKIINTMAIALSLILLLNTQVAFASPPASEVAPCEDWIQNMQFIVEPWRHHSKTYYSGRVRVVHIDTMGEPVCCSSRLVAYLPDSSDIFSGRKCLQLRSVLGGYEWINFSGIRSSYDSHLGLLLKVPVSHYVDGTSSLSEIVKIRFNLSTETLVIEP
ncbi:MAG: hypothetical protein HN353_11855 [Bdellovibrionales bacterium]|jgi:hypothetical protein|nr:hypothetical protein [Bdellovibrionales bacterium]MBT3526844.1 hypothetical protein [Bdellovibrionales bacterium]MBT7668300.1 hypothetical protein [Bdellovibrionales bacterium]